MYNYVLIMINNDNTGGCLAVTRRPRGKDIIGCSWPPGPCRPVDRNNNDIYRCYYGLYDLSISLL